MSYIWNYMFCINVTSSHKIFFPLKHLWNVNHLWNQVIVAQTVLLRSHGVRIDSVVQYTEEERHIF